jgi:hypothetical protein
VLGNRGGKPPGAPPAVHPCAAADAREHRRVPLPSRPLRVVPPARAPRRRAQRGRGFLAHPRRAAERHARGPAAHVGVHARPPRRLLRPARQPAVRCARGQERRTPRLGASRHLANEPPGWTPLRTRGAEPARWTLLRARGRGRSRGLPQRAGTAPRAHSGAPARLHQGPRVGAGCQRGLPHGDRRARVRCGGGIAAHGQRRPHTARDASDPSRCGARGGGAGAAR